MKKIIFAFCVSALCLMAQTTQTSDQEITQLIEKIKIANGDEKRLLINDLKQKLRTQNAQTRQDAFAELRRSMGADKETNRAENAHQEQMMMQKQQQNQGENGLRLQLHQSENAGGAKGAGGKQ